MKRLSVTPTSSVPIISTDWLVALPQILRPSDLGSIVHQRRPNTVAETIVTRLRRPAFRSGAAHEIIDRHKLGVFAVDYLALFDRLVP